MVELLFFILVGKIRYTHWKYSFWPVEYDAKKFGALVNEFLASEAAN